MNEEMNTGTQELLLVRLIELVPCLIFLYTFIWPQISADISCQDGVFFVQEVTLIHT